MLNRVALVLADASESHGGKVSLLGGGWSLTTAGSTPTSLAAFFEFSGDEEGADHTFSFALTHDDGSPVVLKTATGESSPLIIAGQFTIGPHSSDVPAGAPYTAAAQISMGPLPLEPGHIYRWQLTLDGRAEPEWAARFASRTGKDPGAT